MPVKVLSAAIFTVLIWPFVCSLAGGIRFHTGMDLKICILLGSIISLFPGIRLFRMFKLVRLSQIIICLLLFTLFQYRLYNQDLGLLVNYGCADAANHLSFYRSFVSSDPQSYQGFNGLYVCVYIIEKILSVQTPFAFYLSLLFPLLTIAYFLTYFIRIDKLTSALVAAVTSLIVSELIILPIIHYNQADGYLAHIFSVSTVLPAVIWGSSSPVWILLVMLICCRFSYGLQLPDLFAALGCYLVISALRAGQVFYRYLLLSGGVLAVAACVFSISRLMDVFSISGSIISQNLDYAFAAQITGIALLFQLYFYEESDKGKKINSLAFPLLFLIAGSALQAMWLFTTKDADYYFSKLFLYSSLLLAIFVIRLSGLLLQLKSVYLTSSWILLISFLIVAQRPYLPSYYERVQPSGEYKLISPLLDYKVQKVVNEVLKKESKLFAGYYTSRWAQFSFFNALYNQPFDFGTFQNPPAEIPENSCIFWSKNSNDIPRLERYKATATIEWLNEMNAGNNFQEVKYNSPWAGRQVIRYYCR